MTRPTRRLVAALRTEITGGVYFAPDARNLGDIVVGSPTAATGWLRWACRIHPSPEIRVAAWTILEALRQQDGLELRLDDELALAAAATARGERTAA